MSENKMRKKISLGFVAVLVFTGIMVSSMISHSAQIRERDRINAMRYQAEYDSIMAQALRDAEAERALKDSLRGTVTDTTGTAMPGVVVSDSYSCTVTDSAGHYALHRNPKARFVYYTVPDYCEVPTHAPNDHTACFYKAINANDSIYDFTLTRLKNGKEVDHRMIIIGDPQATNVINPYYTGPNDNLVEKSDVARFTDETIADIRHTIDSLPAETPIYGMSMGDDVQYYGGYNDSLELQVRQALGSTKMTVFSVIGNHDQDGKRIYTEKWEQNWGPTDYSFDRGDVHYVCFNDCNFYHGALYYSPGEPTDEQMEWIAQDLALADTSKKVVLCYHIPLTFGNSPSSTAVPLQAPTEHGHFYSSRLKTLLSLLERFKGGYELFCGHTHFALNHEIDLDGHHVLEHCHAAACGAIWQSNINICGTPNGYYIYQFKSSSLANCRYKATLLSPALQMTLFRADANYNKESYTKDWKLPTDSGVVVANVFNADSRWKIVAIENGVEHPMTRINSKGQDAFATGYHHQYSQSVSYWFVSKHNGYLIMNHLYYYKPKSRRNGIIIEATDPYGNVYTARSADIIQEPFYNFAHYYKKRK